MAFTPIPCRPRRPQSKGSVEALAKLCDRLLAYNHEFETIEDLEKIVNTFNENINNEVSQSHNRVVNEVFTYEKEYLLPLPNNKNLIHDHYIPLVISLCGGKLKYLNKKITKSSLVQIFLFIFALPP